MPARVQGGECRCEKCAQLCHGSPGWFAPGQATKAAAFLELTLREFFEAFLIVEYWVGDEGSDVLAPRRVGQPGVRATWGDAFMKAPCALLTETGCRLPFNLRPKECRLAFGCDKERSQHGPKVRDAIQKSWARKQGEITIATEGLKDDA